VDARSVERFDREVTVRSRQEFSDAAAALLIGALAGLAFTFASALGFALAFGSVVALGLALVAGLKRHFLIERLTLDRDAYAIEAVRSRGRRLTSRRARKRLSQSLRTLPADASQRTSCVPPDRVAAFAADIDEIARELEQPETDVDPVSAAACLRLLTHGADSPLLNPDLPIEDLRAALMRIRGGIHTR